ncbi:PKD domain-containing protein [Corallococcus sp. AB049A]|uniref:PQQ-dependent sugar dehydrogenase n=1 Tax=Corallococcus sp. AB049A TaxID=2316721 RepID=UPI000ECB4260|nr:PQQ-dependent sugar dehydrogenase [Corallococcus sp. AB049A]RKI72142.1 PKD domain-containing protein [Corallococcus sp. AB049A]
MSLPRRWPVPFAVCLCLGLSWGLLAAAARAPEPVARALPGGFSSELVVGGLHYPTTFAHLPDGRILVAEKSGVVRLVKDGVLQSAPFLDVSARVNNHHDRGLLGLAVDPDFARNGYVYLLYTYDTDATDDDGPKTSRLARYTAVGDTASPSSELVLVGTAVASSCKDLPPGSDCIPSDSASHSVGNVRFAPDGTLFVSLGDGARFDGVDDDALRAQDLDSLAGKLLRVTRTGAGVPSNPFWNGDGQANRSKVWALGLRNPYRFNLRPGTATPYVGDVGWNEHEEINVAAPGSNFGWPCYEGPGRQRGYEPKAVCQALYARGPGAVRPPLYSWTHAEGQTSTGGAFILDPAFPEQWRGAYFFADYAQQWIRALRVDEHDQLVPGSVAAFATEAGGVVDLSSGPDSQLHVVDILAGELRRIRYPANNTPPVAVASATPREGVPPLQVFFSSAGSRDADGDALQYLWDFGDGVSMSGVANPEHTYEMAGLYVARLTVSDGHGGSHTASVRISVGNLSPVVTLLAPPESFRFKVGDVVTYAGSASDAEDGAIPDNRLAWTVTLVHCTPGACHSHPYGESQGPGGTLTIPDHGDDVRFELTLTATDSAGLTGSRTVTLLPRKVQVTVQTSPPGMEVVFDGTAGPAPRVRSVIAGSTHTVIAPSPQGAYGFVGWSDGGPAEHTFQVGTEDVGLTAFFEPVAPTECPPGQYRAEYFTNRELAGSPVRVRCEGAPLMNYWWAGSPVEGVGPDDFSVRWTGRFSFATGLYFFMAQADDGIRVFVDGSRVINGWRDQSSTSYVQARWMRSGEHSVVVEYYEHGGDAVAGLQWFR